VLSVDRHVIFTFDNVLCDCESCFGVLPGQGAASWLASGGDVINRCLSKFSFFFSFP